jgi:hypothetical protein
LAPEFGGELDQFPGQLRGNQLGRGDAAAVKPLQRFQLARFQAGKIAVGLFDMRSSISE